MRSVQALPRGGFAATDQARQSSTFHPEAVFARVAERIARDLSPDALDHGVTPTSGDHSLNEWAITAAELARARAAAVLVGLVERDDEVHVLLTQRTAGLRDHAGQIAFPGGKMDPDDPSPAATAVREAFEEIGLSPDHVEVLGYLGAYLTRTGFRIVPVVARLHPPFELLLNPAEVVDTFEVPLSHLVNAASWQLERREWKGGTRSFYVVEHGGRAVWGITAGILHILCDRLYGLPAAST